MTQWNKSKTSINFNLTSTSFLLSIFNLTSTLTSTTFKYVYRAVMLRRIFWDPDRTLIRNLIQRSKNWATVLISRCFNICSTYDIFRSILQKFKHIFMRSGFPEKLSYLCFGIRQVDTFVNYFSAGYSCASQYGWWVAVQANFDRTFRRKRLFLVFICFPSNWLILKLKIDVSLNEHSHRMEFRGVIGIFAWIPPILLISGAQKVFPSIIARRTSWVTCLIGASTSCPTKCRTGHPTLPRVISTQLHASNTFSSS